MPTNLRVLITLKTFTPNWVHTSGDNTHPIVTVVQVVDGPDMGKTFLGPIDHRSVRDAYVFANGLLYGRPHHAAEASDGFEWPVNPEVDPRLLGVDQVDVVLTRRSGS